MLSGSPAVGRELRKFERMQIWIESPEIADLAKKQQMRMLQSFRTNAIPLHVVLDPQGRELARFVYRGAASSPEDYLEFLAKGMAKFEGR
jgi:hypothetical protein